MRNLKLVIEYEGTNYVGWQRQENGKSIQGEIEKMLRQITQEKVSLNGAGRTDAGVHAKGQVANFRSQTECSTKEIWSGLNALLPNDIVVHTVEEVPFDFHARYSAKGRRYSYSIRTVPSALLHHLSWYLKYSLDVEIMNRVAQAILGTHDFESLCRTNSDADHYLCSVTTSEWVQEESMLRYEICANRFLHGMVRALVGTMVDVGRGFTPLEDFLKILEKKDRSEAGMAAPACGLVLESVLY